MSHTIIRHAITIATNVSRNKVTKNHSFFLLKWCKLVENYMSRKKRTWMSHIIIRHEITIATNVSRDMVNKNHSNFFHFLPKWCQLVETS